MKDILMIYADELPSIKETIAAAFPMTEYQRCIIHIAKKTLRHVSDKDKKIFANSLKTVYHASDEEIRYAQMLSIKEKWDKLYPNAKKRWVDGRDVVCPIFK